MVTLLFWTSFCGGKKDRNSGGCDWYACELSDPFQRAPEILDSKM
jgi:hypothetical protein